MQQAVAGIHPEYQSFQQALLFSRLSQSAYNAAELVLQNLQAISISGVAGTKQIEYSCRCIGAQLAGSNYQQQATGCQYGIWHVEGLGIAVAYRGTASPEDVCVDLEFAPQQLANSGGVVLNVHAGMCSGAKEAADIILAVYNQHCTDSNTGIPLFLTGVQQICLVYLSSYPSQCSLCDMPALHPGLTWPWPEQCTPVLKNICACAELPPALLAGHSLGGGYAMTTLLHLLATAPDVAVAALAKGGVWTFGAPLVLGKFSESPADGSILQQLVPAKFKQYATPEFSTMTMNQFGVNRASCMHL